MSECPSPTSTAACMKRFDKLDGKLDRMDVAIRGDGEERPGIVTRLDRLERDTKRAGRFVWLVVGALATAVVALIFNR